MLLPSVSNVFQLLSWDLSVSHVIQFGFPLSLLHFHVVICFRLFLMLSCNSIRLCFCSNIVFHSNVFIVFVSVLVLCFILS